MAISITWGTKTINVPQADLTFISTGVYELNVDTFRLALKDLEDGEDGINFPTTHNHVAPVTVGGVQLARIIEIINGYTVTFEDGQYAVRLAGANNNIPDVTNVNQVSIRSNNSAGLIQVTSAGSTTEVAEAVWAQVLESTYTSKDLIRLMSAILFGKVSGGGSGTENFRDMADSKNRVVVTVDSSGNRTAVVKDPT